MASKTSTLRVTGTPERKKGANNISTQSIKILREIESMSDNETDNETENTSDNEFDFIDAYDDVPVASDDLLPENAAPSAINVGFIGVGGGGGKLAKAFIDCGFTQTLLVNTTEKDQPNDLDPIHLVLVPGADGVGKDVKLGERILSENSTMVEDAVRNRIGDVDWLFVLAGGGGGTGSASYALRGALSRYLKSNESSGQVVYIVSRPTAQELLNPTISTNYDTLIAEVANEPHIIIDNERQLNLLRGKVGMLGLYPVANKNFAKMISQVLKLASEPSAIQTFDSKDLERCLSQSGRTVIGTSIVRDVDAFDLGSKVLTGCLRSSPCPSFVSDPKVGVLLLLLNTETAGDPVASKRLEAAFSYVGGRTKTLLSGVYVKENLPGVIAIVMFGGISES